VAIVFVMLAHTQVPALHAAGTVGVTVFFTLSGFLITALLLEDAHDHGSVRLGRFFARRVRRLAPALALFLAAMAVLGVVSASPVAPGARDLVGAVLYVGNYTGAMAGRDTTITHTWSLAVEEQFYLVWPFLLIGLLRLGRGRWLIPVLVALALGSALGRLLLWDGGTGIFRVNFGTDMRVDALLVGCLVAVFLSRRGPTRVWAGTTVFALAAMSLFSLASLTWELLAVTTAVPLVTACVLLHVAGGGGGGAVLAAAPLALLGRRSYGLYLWHYPTFGLAVAAPAGHKIVVWLGVLALTAAIVYLSWRCVEEPFLDKGHSDRGKDWRGLEDPSRVMTDVRGSGSPGPRGRRAESSTTPPNHPWSTSRGTTLPPGVNPL
jgi:peptidoglycan/LPS O-acetylase OafA/YrhL